MCEDKNRFLDAHNFKLNRKHGNNTVNAMRRMNVHRESGRREAHVCAWAPDVKRFDTHTETNKKAQIFLSLVKHAPTISVGHLKHGQNENRLLFNIVLKIGNGLHR